MNFDWSVEDMGKSHDRGFAYLTANGTFVWVRPSNIVKTHSSDYNSILDFIFTTADAPWVVERSEIVVEDGDFPDTGWTSDHRPVAAVFRFEGNASRAGELMARSPHRIPTRRAATQQSKLYSLS